MLNKLLDASVYFSFDKTGYKRHQKTYSPIDENVFVNKDIVITGGTSGIGEALAKRLAKYKCNIIVTGRSLDKFNNSSLVGLPNVKFYELDLANFENINQLVKNLIKVDFIVCNAGGMPSEPGIVNDKYDTIFASQVIGHYKLIEKLIDTNKLKSCVHFNSSGGMYLVKMDLSDLTWAKSRYDKVASYANAKRAQIILCEELAKNYPNISFTSSHPGWVATNAVKEAIPGFYKFTQNRLRNSDEGADTMFWCLANHYNLVNGGFYFDRDKKNPYIFPWTRPSAKDREELIELLKE
jgi:dehydrogenase/reductase SDR family protein 12